MASSLSWLAYSEHERRQVLDIVELFRDRQTLDELGIGTVRDAFAELLFPGTSTIQTRAKYFLFIPWIYRDLERRRVPSHEIARRARRDEIRLMNALKRAGELDGLIGRVAGARIKRIASSIYWQGLGRWGIRLFPGSQDHYHRSIDAIYAAVRRATNRDDDGDTTLSTRVPTWHAGLPDPPDRFPDEASFRLERHEAEYLRERLMSQVPDTMLARLVDLGRPVRDVEEPWLYPELNELTPRIREQLEHARNFSVVVYGASLLYNRMLAELIRNDEWIEGYGAALNNWWSVAGELEHALLQWDRDRFWAIAVSGGARIPILTRRFIDAWLDLSLAGLQQDVPAEAVWDTPRARDLIHRRERALKRGLARLDNRRALELWSGASGTAPLTYRWGTVRQIVQDIIDGLAERSDA